MTKLKYIDGYSNTYMISSSGIVYNKQGRRLKPRNVANGYLSVLLSKDGKSTGHLVHRLVAEAFLPGRKKYVRHIGSRSDNSLSNIYWTDDMPGPARKVYLKYDDNNNLLAIYQGAINAANSVNSRTCNGLVHAIQRGVKYKGFRWERY